MPASGLRSCRRTYPGLRLSCRRPRIGPCASSTPTRAVCGIDLRACSTAKRPKRFLVISPFFDQEAELAQRIRQRWPKCQIEIVVQQKTTNLPVAALKKLRSGIALSELRNSSRRLHAKLLAWESSKGTGCLVGSANFTTAAFDARNVETCLLVSDAEEVVSGLFDGQLAKRPLAFDDFDPGTEQEPKAEDVDSTTLRLTSRCPYGIG